MGKFLLLVLLVVAAFLYLRARASAGRARPPAETGTPGSASEAVVACARCGVHVPLSESIELSGKRYCSQEHSCLD